MLNKLKQLASFMNLPVLVLLVSITVVCFVIVKFLQAYLFPKSSKRNKHISKDKNGSIKPLSRKKRNKKQRSLEIASEHVPKRNVPTVPVDDEAVVDTIDNQVIEKPSAPTIEVERVSQLNKKQDKKKSKSKKKKVQNNETAAPAPVVTVTATPSSEDGEWQTVRSKDQKMQRNKEKRRQDEAASAVTPVKPNPITPFTPPTYTSIPSTAKDVAPRFARAAGEEWQEGASKRQAVNVTKSTTIVNRSPMLPAAAQQPQASNKWATVTSAPLPADIWENQTTTSIGFSSTQQTWSNNKSSAISWTTAPVKPNSWAKPKTTAWETTGDVDISDNIKHCRSKETKLLQFGDLSPSSVKDVGRFLFRFPYTRGAVGSAFSAPETNFPPTALPVVLPFAESALWTPSLDQPDWHGDAKSDDWVHVTTPSPTSAPIAETWTTAGVYQQTMQQWSDPRISDQTVVNPVQAQKEHFHMEPEGVSVSSMDADDPWNMDTYKKEGDWSPPEAHWSNSHEEWTAPAPVAKPQPSYFDESSEEEKVTASTPLQPVSNVQTVVGAGSELLQAQNQQANKKARRRRKKKQTTEADNESSSKVSVTVSPVIEETTKVQSSKTTGTMDGVDESKTNDDWSISKQSKKKKPRVRKAE